MPEQRQPQFHPISMLPVLAPHIDGMLESSEEQYETLLPAKEKPHVLDDYTPVSAKLTKRYDVPYN